MMFMAGFIGASFLWWLVWILLTYYGDMKFRYLKWKFRHRENTRHIRSDLRRVKREIRWVFARVLPAPSTSAMDRVGVVGMVIVLFLIGYALLVNKYWDILFNGS